MKLTQQAQWCDELINKVSMIAKTAILVTGQINKQETQISLLEAKVSKSIKQLH